MIPDKYLHPVSSLLNCAADQPLAAAGSGLEVEDLSLVLGAKRPGHGQQVHCLEQGCLSLGVGPEEDHHAGRKLQVQLDQVAEIVEDKAGEIHLYG